MSIYVMSWVWAHSKANGGPLLTLLAIADCAHEDGGGAWPSNRELQRKARMTDRGIQKAIVELVNLGELEVDYNTGPKGCNRYRVLMRTPEQTTVPPERGSGNPRTEVTPPPNHVRGEPSMNRQ